jgi:hypothetical protein
MSALDDLIAREAIRELVLLYSRGVDRQDFALLRSLYTEDATDSHGDSFDGPANEYCDFLERSLPHLAYSGHHVCNHLISVDGETGEGEVYALALHVSPDGKGGLIELSMAVRYIDRYRREAGVWKFAKRVVTYDMRWTRAFDGSVGDFKSDPSFAVLGSPLFVRNPRGGSAE